MSKSSEHIRPWQGMVLAEASRLQRELDVALYSSEPGRPEFDVGVIRRDIAEARAIAELPEDEGDGGEPTRGPRTMRTKLAIPRLRRLPGVQVEEAWAALMRARQMLFLVQPTPALLAQIPELRSELKVRLPKEDARFDQYLRALDDIAARRTDPNALGEVPGSPPIPPPSHPPTSASAE